MPQNEPFDFPSEPPHMRETAPPQARSHGAPPQQHPAQRTMPQQGGPVANRGAVAQRPQTPTVQMDEHGKYVIRNADEERAVIDRLKQSGILPRSITTFEQASVAIQALRSMGLNPYVSVSQAGFINGSFSLFKDLPLAVARKTGEMTFFEEFSFYVDENGKHAKISFANGNTHKEPTGWVCYVQRKDGPVTESFYTVDMAKKAKLWGKQGPWTEHPQVMLMRKARNRALSAVFADVLNCSNDTSDEQTVMDGQ